MLKRNVLAVSLSLGLAAVAGQVSAGTVGGGATLPENLFNEIISNHGYTFEVYTGVGSGTGKSAFFSNDATLFNGRRVQDGLTPYAAGTPVHYAGSDSVVSAVEFGTYNTVAVPALGGLTAQQAYGDLIQLPFAATSVAVAFNNSDPSVAAGLDLTSQQVAEIFNGQITSWDEINPTFEEKPIIVIYRSDGSGTVEIFTRHLSAVAPSLFQTSNNFLTARQGTPDPSVTFIGASGNGGVAQELANNDGAITFLSPDFVDVTARNQVAAILNRNSDPSDPVSGITGSHHFMPSETDVQLTIGSVNPPSVTNALAWAPVFPDPANGYPIAGFTFLLASTCYENDAEGNELVSFIEAHYAGEHDLEISAADLIPLPQNWKDAANNLIVSRINGSSCAGVPGR